MKINEKILKEEDVIAKCDSQINVLNEKKKKAQANIDKLKVQMIAELTKGLSLEEIQSKLGNGEDINHE